MMSVEKEVENVMKEEGIKGEMRRTDLRIVWVMKERERMNLNFPYLSIQWIEEKER
jgi:hypothetical protein